MLCYNIFYFLQKEFLVTIPGNNNDQERQFKVKKNHNF